MNDWETDPDAWKKEGEVNEDKKPWEEPDAWKLEGGYEPGETDEKKDPRVLRSYEFTIGVRPTVDVEYLEEIPETITVEDRDALKLITKIADLQKVNTKEGELFQYSRDRNMWVRIPWELL